jgi:hypothetical protein
MSSLPVFSVLIVLPWRAQDQRRRGGIAIFLVSLMPSAAAKAFLLLHERQAQMRESDLRRWSDQGRRLGSTAFS